MASKYLALVGAAAYLVLAAPAFAQVPSSQNGTSDPSGAQGSMNSNDAMLSATGSTPGPESDPANDPVRGLLQYRGAEYAVGARFWVVHVPRFIVGLFTRIEPGWNGGTNIAAGPEFVYRSNGMEVQLGVMYVGYGADAGFFRGLNEPPNATERIESNLWGLYVTSTFMWGWRLHRMFEIQLGAGLGAGYIGGNLYRSQAYQSGSEWRDCVNEPGGSTPPAGPECMNDNHHYTRQAADGSRYSEPNWFGGGYVPVIIPWVSLPQVAFHFRPHRNFDIKLEGGYGLISFYGGASVHVIF